MSLPHSPILGTVTFEALDEAAVSSWAARLATALLEEPRTRPMRIALQGELGAGKTTFTRALLRAAGVTGRIKSPTYALVEPYDIEAAGQRWPAVHLDLYRMSDASEWHDAGLDELVDQAQLVLVEWPDKAGDRLAAMDLVATLEPIDATTRRLRLDAISERGRWLLTLLTR